MDRNSIIGILLIFGILVVFSIMNQPSKEEIEEAKRKRDSIAQVELQKKVQEDIENEAVKAKKEAANLPTLFQMKQN